MAHYVASINAFEHGDGPTSVSVKVYRVFDFGARPVRPVWEAQITIERSTTWRPDAWLRELLRGMQEELLAE